MFKFLLSLLLIIPFSLFAQQTDERIVALDDVYPGQNVTTFDLRERSEAGQKFFNTDWLTGQFVFDDGSLSKRIYFLKYNIQTQELYVNLDGGTYQVPMQYLSGFVLKGVLPEDKGFISHEFVLKHVRGKSGRMILEKVIEGDYGLYILHDVSVLKPNYVPALDAGDLNTKYVEKKLYYLNDRGVFKEIPKKKKKAVQFFSQIPSAKRYIDKHKMKIKSEEYLKSLVNYMNKNLN
ncbi:MAG: hypothetical protein DWQ02_14265 [Bacteroidetes bacterium]|nr:MAG: hypothetical protein DWQ02_14265 [Bacteroidota bacterium]